MRRVCWISPSPSPKSQSAARCRCLTQPLLDPSTVRLLPPPLRSPATSFHKTLLPIARHERTPRRPFSPPCASIPLPSSSPLSQRLSPPLPPFHAPIPPPSTVYPSALLSCNLETEATDMADMDITMPNLSPNSTRPKSPCTTTLLLRHTTGSTLWSTPPANNAIPD